MVLAGGGEAADRFMDELRLALPAPSLGGVETLVSQPRWTSHAGWTPAERSASGIPDGFVRVSIGVEDPADLIRDFAGALAAAESALAGELHETAPQRSHPPSGAATPP
jgi:cystathionine beta-lyase/cystathionine gamma-synthase